MEECIFLLFLFLLVGVFSLGVLRRKFERGGKEKEGGRHRGREGGRERGREGGRKRRRVGSSVYIMQSSVRDCVFVDCTQCTCAIQQ